MPPINAAQMAAMAAEEKRRRMKMLWIIGGLVALWLFLKK